MYKIEPTQTIADGRPIAARTPSRSARATARRLIVLGGLTLVFTGCAAAVIEPPPPAGAAAAPAAPPPAPYNGPTLPKLLGIPECFEATKCCAQKVCTCLKRQFPGPGAAAPNLGEVGPQSAPAVKCAAEIIAAEAEAPQKVDALRYLGKVGCTKCYPCVEEGLLAALDDCTEVVRYEAAKAIRATATEQCKCCQCTSCCTQKIFEKLYKVAYETNSQGCPVECSPRVRRVARQALCMCGGPMVSDEDLEEPTPAEGPSGAPSAAPAQAPPATTEASRTPAEKPPAAPAAAAAAVPTAAPTVSALAAPQTPPLSEKKMATAPTVVVSDVKAAPTVTVEDTTAPIATPVETAPPEKKEAATSTAAPVENRSAAAAPTMILNGPTLRVATIPAAEPTPTLRQAATTRLRIVNSESPTECSSCGSNPSASEPSSNPFR